jgi:hypothetical protein
MKNMHRVEALKKNYEMEEGKRHELMTKIEKKSMKSEVAKRRLEEERAERIFREFIQNEDKKLNVKRIASQQEYRRDNLDEKIHKDDLRSEKIRMERQEIMHTKQKLRREIDKDKNTILQDFEQIKQGKVDPTLVAKKYGYVARPREENQLSQSHMPSVKQARPNTMGNSSLKNSAAQVAPSHQQQRPLK